MYYIYQETNNKVFYFHAFIYTKGNLPRRTLYSQNPISSQQRGRTMTHTYGNDPSQHGKVLQPGIAAPDFTLESSPTDKVTLSQYRGRPVVLVFYPADWSPVCGDQLALYNELIPDFEQYQAQVIGISVDGVWSHQEFAKARNLHYPLLADFHPKGEVAKRYGVYSEPEGISDRALFVIDKDGIIAWSYIANPDENPGAAGILDALDAIAQKEKQGS